MRDIKKKLALVTLGCPKNFVDSEGILVNCKKDGYQIIDDLSEAEVIIVNTCGFIEPAKQESIETILELAQLKDTGKCKKLIVTGCMAQLYPEELKNELPEVDLVIGNRNIPLVTSACNKLFQKFESDTSVKKAVLSYRPVETPHTAYLKIAEGCDNRCTYCVIPDIRGNYRSQPTELIIQEAKDLIADGIKEINLIAQETTKYGLDLYGEIKISQLLRELSQLNNSVWIRLLYTHPATITDDLIDAIATCNNICNYIDLPLQHISDKILTSMNRKINKEKIIQIIDKIKDRIPDIVLRTTFIVGFPGETEEDYQELANFMQDIKFDKLGVFSYSSEEGTAACQMEHQVPHKIAEERREELMLIQQDISLEINENIVGKTLSVLIDEQASESLIGRSYRDALEIDGIIEIPNTTAEIGQFVDVEIIDYTEYDLIGKIVNPLK